MNPRRPDLTLLLVSLILAATLNAPAEGWAKGPATSGGYARPATKGRTPSAASGRQIRSPSVSGGYRRPPPTAAAPSAPIAGSSADRALSRQAARQSLDAFRARQQPSWDLGDTGVRRPSTASAPQPVRRPSIQWPTGIPASRTASAHRQPAATRPLATFDWSGTWPWILLAALAQPGVAEFFYHHAEDSGFRQWRAAAAARAQEDPAIADQLAELDARLANLSGPRDPTYPPPLGEAQITATASFPFASLLTGIFLLLVAAILSILLWRRFFGDVAARAQRSPTLSAQDRRPAWLRPNMLLALDPTPFILAGQSIKIQAPQAATASGLLGVERLSELAGEGQRWYRLYVAGGTAFVQLHLDGRGQPDECRYFSQLDEVTPADADEWAVWLDRDEGLIGWPEFETKDGVRYQRLWSPGSGRLAPRRFTESAPGETPCRQQAMFYARPTGAQPPAPQTEYLWVAAHEQSDGAWVSLAVGIDIPAASLNLN